MAFSSQIRPIAGHLAGFRCSSLRIALTTDAYTSDLAALHRLETKLHALLIGEPQASLRAVPDKGEKSICAPIARMLSALECQFRTPSLDRLIPGPPATAEPGESMSEIMLFETVSANWTIQCLSSINRCLPLEDEGAIKNEISGLQPKAPSLFTDSSNARHLFLASRRLGIPIRLIPAGIYLCGWGKRSLLLQSSATDRTPVMSVNLTRDKAATQRMLSLCGLPGTAQRSVESLEGAKAAARELGFPVVVKPRALDGGVGVTTQIRTETELAGAVERARAEAPQLLVERHITGREYRLLFVNGTLLSVHERVPAHVTGDGEHSVEQLIEIENNYRYSIVFTGFSNVPIALGDDADRCLAGQGLTRSSIPAAGQKVRLTTVPKVATGGAVVKIDPSTVHPDIISAAVTAVRMVRLDVAGVDYIGADHTRSWRDTGGAITEVNAIPQINRMEEFDAHETYMRSITDGVGRVPAILVIGDYADAKAALAEIAAGAEAKSLAPRLCLTDDAAVSLDESKAAFAGMKAALFGALNDTTTGSIIVLQNVDNIQQNGVALEHFDAVAICDADPIRAARAVVNNLVRPHLGTTLLLPAPMLSSSQLMNHLSSFTNIKGYNDSKELAAQALSILHDTDTSHVEALGGPFRQ